MPLVAPPPPEVRIESPSVIVFNQGTSPHFPAFQALDVACGGRREKVRENVVSRELQCGRKVGEPGRPWNEQPGQPLWARRPTPGSKKSKSGRRPADRRPIEPGRAGSPERGPGHSKRVVSCHGDIPGHSARRFGGQGISGGRASSFLLLPPASSLGRRVQHSCGDTIGWGMFIADSCSFRYSVDDIGTRRPQEARW